MSRISIEVSPADHKAIKELALNKGVTIRELVWKPHEKKLHDFHKKAKKQKGYGAGDPDCPLCQQYENARNGRYNKKTERGLKQSMKEIKAGKAKSFSNFEELMRDLKD